MGAQVAQFSTLNLLSSASMASQRAAVAIAAALLCAILAGCGGAKECTKLLTEATKKATEREQEMDKCGFNLQCRCEVIKKNAEWIKDKKCDSDNAEEVTLFNAEKQLLMEGSEQCKTGDATAVHI